MHLTLFNVRIIYSYSIHSSGSMILWTNRLALKFFSASERHRTKFCFIAQIT